MKILLSRRTVPLTLTIIGSMAIGLRADAQVTTTAPTISSVSGTLRGSVSDSSHQPLPAVEITIIGMGRSMRTDSTGAFVFHNVPAGSYRIGAKRLGYQPLASAVTISDASGATIAFVLASVAQLLDAQEITGQRGVLPPGAPQRMFDFYLRRKTGLGTYITRDQIERAGSVRATLFGLSGVRVYTAPGGQVRGMNFVRCSGSLRDAASPVAYFLDGRQTNEGVFSFLSDIDIEALETYKGPASMPAEAVGNACAAVFIWTRR